MLGPLKKRVIRKPKAILGHGGRVVGSAVRVYHGSRMAKDPTTGKWTYLKKPLRMVARKAFRDLPKKMNIFNPQMDERAFSEQGEFSSGRIGAAAPVPSQDPEVAKEEMKATLMQNIYDSQVSDQEKARQINTAEYDNPDQATDAENNVFQKLDRNSIVGTYQSLLDSLKRAGAIK